MQLLPFFSRQRHSNPAPARPFHTGGPIDLAGLAVQVPQRDEAEGAAIDGLLRLGPKEIGLAVGDDLFPAASQLHLVPRQSGNLSDKNLAPVIRIDKDHDVADLW